MIKEDVKKLEAQIKITIAGLEESQEYLKEATKPIEPSVALGRLTRMEAIGEKSVNEAMLQKTVLKLEKLKNALDRIDQNIYGVCIRCEKEISLGRLQAVPESLICISCAEKKK